MGYLTVNGKRLTANGKLSSYSAPAVPSGLPNSYPWIPKAGSTIVTIGGVGANYFYFGYAIGAINDGSLDPGDNGNIVLQVIASGGIGSRGTDDTNIILYPSGYSGFTSYNSIIIYPTVSGLTISDELNLVALLTLNAPSNVTIDGRVNRTGSTPSLTFTNNGTGNKTIEFVNTPENCSAIYSNGINESLVPWVPKAGSTIVTIGFSGEEALTVKELFDAINNGDITGDIVGQIIDDTDESALPAILYESGHGGLSNYTSITIYPTLPNLTISGNISGYLITLNGADNVTIDGRVNRTGSTPSLTINNSNTNGGEVNFINTPENSTVIYCNGL